KAAEAVVGVEYTDEQRELMLERIESNLDSYDAIHNVDIPNEVAPPYQFNPVLAGRTVTVHQRPAGAPTHTRPVVHRPDNDADLAFLTVLELAELVRTRRVTSAELTELCLRRLERHDPELRCVVNLTPERARRHAAAADREIAAGKYRGPLHGIPYGVKDMLAVPGYPTTWGAAVYADRVLDQTATVIERLDAAGAVLVAKLSMGELGLNDTWYRGQTMNPWKPDQGASGSSSGSAAAVSAGLVPFAIAEETMGSIIGPATRTGVTGLRPSFGRVSRYGAMTMCWSLDKLGPMARDVEDCAVVLEAIAGPDGKDASVTHIPYTWDPARPLSAIRVGYFSWAFDAPHETQARDQAALHALQSLGVTPVPVELPTDLPVNAALIVRVEAAASLDEVARVHGLDSLAVQDGNGWPTIMRSDQFVPAVEYLQAMRIRTLLMQRMEEVFQHVDVFMTPTFGVLPITDLTGYPCVVVPNGLTADGLPESISFIGRLYGESAMCTVARAWQEATGFHRLRPTAFANNH
ncbi:MAG TPA: amidase, partial [Gemmatimonadaceae bacterium]|nr:amidase [Gemmatimonadaceae bacterium]